MQTDQSSKTLRDLEMQAGPVADTTQKVTAEQMKVARALLANGLSDNGQADLEIPVADTTKQITVKDNEQADLGVPMTDPTKLTTVKIQVADTSIPVTPIAKPKKSSSKKQSAKVSKRDLSSVYMLKERCRHLCLSLFLREQSPIQSLGFTSSIQGEGKSFMALITAQVLANDSSYPVTLIECNWEHPTLHAFFNIPATPGLAEWVQGMCDEDEIRHRVGDNLTVIPAGDGARNPVKLLRQIHQRNLLKTLADPEGAIIVELPPIITNGYGSLAASLTDSLILVVRTEAVPASMVEEAYSQLKNLPVEGIILNQVESKIPRWLRQLL